MRNPMNRRGALAALAGVGAALALSDAVTAASDPDARIFELLGEGKRQWKLIGEYCNLCDEVVAKKEDREGPRRESGRS
jgi:hypothetical protein